MNILYWNEAKEQGSMTGIKRCEDELYENVRKIGVEGKVERIQRTDSKIFGNVIASWLLRYKCRDADIVHATSPTVAPAIYFRKPQKLVITVYDLIPMFYPSSIADISHRLQWLFLPGAIKKADKIIAISEFVKRKELMDTMGIEEEKIEVVYIGVDHQKYYPKDKEKAKEKFNLNPDEKHILVVASNDEYKRIDIAKAVFQNIRKQREDVKLLKAGYAEGLEGEGIINTNWIPEDKMPLLYNAADVFLHPAEYETFGLPIVEAMACGVPTILANVGSNPEVVESYGNMIDLDSDAYIVQFSNKILENIDKGIDTKAIEQSKKFTWEKTAKETIEVYKEVVQS